MKKIKIKKQPYDQDQGKKSKPMYPLSHVERLISPKGEMWDVWQIKEVQ
jgi:hypothetical protein